MTEQIALFSAQTQFLDSTYHDRYLEAEPDTESGLQEYLFVALPSNW